METKQLTCVNCPKGCHITVAMQDSKPVNITGYTCLQGKNYAMQEVVDPMRILTTTVKVNHGTCNVLPVISEKQIPLRLWQEAMEEVKKTVIEAPVIQGQVIITDFLHLGVNIIAARSMQRQV